MLALVERFACFESQARHPAYRTETNLQHQNGEKLNPIRIEEIVESNPQVKGAVVVGSNRLVRFDINAVFSLAGADKRGTGSSRDL